MAVRLDAAGDYLQRTANLPTTTAFTVCGWTRVITDLGSTTFQPLAADLNGSFDAWYLYWSNTGGANEMRVGCAVGGVESSGAALASRPAVGTDFFWYVKCSGTGAGLLEAGWRPADSNTFVTATATMSASVGTLDDLRLGNVIATYALDGRFWNAKCWDRALTAAELLIESYYARPMFPASVNFWWPLPNASNTNDSSGNGRNATVGGTLTTEDGVWGQWKPGSSRVYISTPTTGSAAMVFGAGSSTLTGEGALAGPAALVFGAGAAALTGAGALAGSCDLVFDDGTSTLTGTGTLVGSADLVFGAGSSTLLGAGALAGSSALVFGEAAVLTGAGALAGTADMVFGASLALSGDILGTADMVFAAGSSTLTGAGTLAGSAALVFGAGSSALVGAGALAGAAALAFTNAGDLTNATSGEIAGSATLAFAAGSSTLTGSGALLGVAAMEFLASLRPTVQESGVSGGWIPGTLRELRRRTKKELLEERIALGILPAPVVEALPPVVQAKVKKAGTVTLRALLGSERAEAMSVDMLQAELDHISRRTKAEKHRQRLIREDEELLLL